MGDSIEPGAICEIKSDMIIDGQKAFAAGELVSVEKVDPNPQKPQFRYVVRSTSLGRNFQLSEDDFVVSGRVKAPAAAGPADTPSSRPAGAQTPAGSAKPAETAPKTGFSLTSFIRGNKKTLVWLALVFVIIAGVLGYKLYVGKKNEPQGPMATLDKFFHCAEANDMEGMMACFEPQLRKSESGMRDWVALNFGPEKESAELSARFWVVYKPSSMRYTPSIDGSKATVKVVNADQVGEATIRLVKTEDKWYIVLWNFSKYSSG
jgi:hypothetical protein